MAARSDKGTVYELNGPETAPVVVLIHGVGVHRQNWRWMLPALAARYRVLSYDLFGHGESAPPPGTPTLSLYSTQLGDLLDDLGIESCALVGFSMGGMINRHFAQIQGKRVRALAILNSVHDRGEALQKAAEARVALAAEEGAGATIDTALERWFTPAFRGARPDIVGLFRQWVLANDPAIYAKSCHVLAHGVPEILRPDPPIAHPTLVMTSENDSASTPAMAEAIAAEIVGARVVIVPRLQHLGLVEEPALFSEPLLRFLDEVMT